LPVIIIGICLFAGLRVFAATNIDATDYNHWAWNDMIGWIDFYTTGNVYISGSGLTGYANSNVGYIAFDCATSPPTTPSADCNVLSDWKVTNTGGTLTGWAWNDQIGWISFNSSDTGTCPNPSCYSVTYANGVFSGWAWNDIIGWISFNCGDTACGTVDYKVRKSSSGIMANAYLVSSTFDTGATGGVVYNTLLYQGTKPTGTQVGFQFAASDSSSGPWIFKGYDGTDTTYYVPIGPNVPIALNSILYNNKRYFRYKIFLDSDSNHTVTPQVDDIIVTWSR